MEIDDGEVNSDKRVPGLHGFMVGKGTPLHYARWAGGIAVTNRNAQETKHEDAALFSLITQSDIGRPSDIRMALSMTGTMSVRQSLAIPPTD